MKRTISILLTLVMCLTMMFSLCIESFAAASWPSLSSSSYCEFKASKQINVYKNTGLSTRGTSSPSKSYNASISKGDVCKIYKITSSYVQVNYPTSSGNRTGYIKRSDLVSVSAPSRSYKASAKQTTYVAPGGSSYGYIARGDTVYECGKSGSYTCVIYTAKSGSRAFKLGWISTSSTASATLRFPLKGSITRSSSCKTNGQYCDYKASSGTPIYAPANGTVYFRQTYATSYGKLASYGNQIYFVSSDKVYTVRMAHLSKFNGVSLKYTASLGYPCSADKYSCSTITLATKTVKQGDLLGYVGSTGNASGPHLHLEVAKNGSAVNPATVCKTW